MSWLSGTNIIVDRSKRDAAEWWREGRKKFVRLPVSFAGIRDGDPGPLFHELAHFLEVVPDARRVRAILWGIKFPERRVVIAGKVYKDPDFTAPYATRREIRTFAIEGWLMRAAGLSPKDPEHYANIAKWLPDWIRVPGKSEEDRVAWCIDQYLAAASKLTDENVLHRLNEVRRLWWSGSPKTFRPLAEL